MRVNLPNSAFLGNIDPFFRSFDGSDPSNLEITGHKKWIAIHPMVLSMIAAIGLTVDSSRIRCEKLEAKSKHYLERMGLFSFLGIESDMQITEHESAGRFIPITQIKNSAELTKFITEMIPLLHLEPKQAESIKYIVSELVRNVLEHSCSQYGAILAAQYYKKSNTIKIGIVDTGVGIQKAINQSHAATTHMRAIQLALTPGITGTTTREGGTEYNAGAGLFFIKSIAKINRDFFVIYSGDTMYKLLKTRAGAEPLELYADPFQDRHSVNENFPIWNGTIIGIDISLDATEKFTLLLDLIHGTYIKSIRERKKAKYKLPKFI